MLGITAYTLAINLLTVCRLFLSSYRLLDKNDLWVILMLIGIKYKQVAMNKKTPKTRVTSKSKASTRLHTASKTSIKAKRKPIKAVVKTKKVVQSKGIKHHAKRLYHLTPKFVHGMVAGAFLGIVVVASFGYSQGVNALSINAPRDCDDYAVIHCGALSTSELKKHYSDKGVATMYSYYHITSSQVSSMDSTAVSGSVQDDGTVTVKGKVVASNARTIARKFIKGSSTVTQNGVTFYPRHVTTEFARSTSAAFVVMKDGVFQFAILAPCGNPIIATPKQLPKPAPTPAPTPSPSPTPTPPPVAPARIQVCDLTTHEILTIDETDFNSSLYSKDAAVCVAPPPVAPAPPVTPEVTTLPNTGPGAVLIILGLAILGGYVFHVKHLHSRHRKHAAHAK